jgi:hypothetical protein
MSIFPETCVHEYEDYTFPNVSVYSILFSTKVSLLQLIIEQAYSKINGFAVCLKQNSCTLKLHSYAKRVIY